jgi:hypothetical protein
VSSDVIDRTASSRLGKPFSLCRGRILLKRLIDNPLIERGVERDRRRANNQKNRVVRQERAGFGS